MTDQDMQDQSDYVDDAVDEVEVVNEKTLEPEVEAEPKMSGFAAWHERISTEPVELSPEVTARMTSGGGIVKGIVGIFALLILLRGLQLFPG